MFTEPGNFPYTISSNPHYKPLAWALLSLLFKQENESKRGAPWSLLSFPSYSGSVISKMAPALSLQKTARPWASLYPPLGWTRAPSISIPLPSVEP